MMSAETLEYLDGLARLLRPKCSRQPFGGIQVIPYTLNIYTYTYI